MAAVKQTQKTVAFTNLDIVVTGTESAYGTKNVPQYYNLCTVKGINSIFDPSPANYNYSVMAKIVINWVDGQGVSSELSFDIQDVTNQAGWTANLAGISQAVLDISTAKSNACGITALAPVLAALKENEFVKVKDSNGDIFAMKAETNESTGVVTYSYIDATGAAAVPVPPITFETGAAGTQETPAASTEVGAGAVTAGKKSVSIFNQGGAAGTVLGQPLAAGLSVSLAAQDNNTLDAVSFDATGTSFLIITTQ